jgi:hypothetical protein
VNARITPEQAIELIAELVERAKELEDKTREPLLITAFVHQTPAPSEEAPS